MARGEARLAYSMLFPTFLIVFSIVLFPVLANFWISVKPVELGSLRAPRIFVTERLHGQPQKPGDDFIVEYRLRNSSQKQAVGEVVLTDRIPAGMAAPDLDRRCAIGDGLLTCQLGDWKPKQRERLRIRFTADTAFFQAATGPRASKPRTVGEAENVLTNLDFTLDNFKRVFGAREFTMVLWVTIAYTVFGTLGSLILGLFAAQLLNAEFRGRAILRGLFLFPYVSPVIAVAFTWVFLLDPLSGTINALLQRMAGVGEAINFLGRREVPFEVLGITLHFPLALATVIAFEAWRYFPLAFLFILARLQALPSDLYEAAEMDGASPFQKFWYITLPQLMGVLAVLFLLRFIWTFNKFDDIFLLTGGASGTRTLTVEAYEQGFALANLGAGAAVSVVIFMVLALFCYFYFRTLPKEEGL